jgi:hypothetical protein
MNRRKLLQGAAATIGTAATLTADPKFIGRNEPKTRLSFSRFDYDLEQNDLNANKNKITFNTVCEQEIFEECIIPTKYLQEENVANLIFSKFLQSIFKEDVDLAWGYNKDDTRVIYSVVKGREIIAEFNTLKKFENRVDIIARIFTLIFQQLIMSEEYTFKYSNEPANKNFSFCFIAEPLEMN